MYRACMRRTVRLGNVVDQFHDKHSLSDTGASEKTNLASTLVGGQQIHDLRAMHT